MTVTIFLTDEAIEKFTAEEKSKFEGLVKQTQDIYDSYHEILKQEKIEEGN